MRRRPRRGVSLQRALQRALLVGSAATTSGCCGAFFTRWVEAYEYTHLTRIDAEQLPRELRDPARRYTSDPDRATCAAICGAETVSCKIAAVQAAQVEPGTHLRCDYRAGEPEWRSAPPSLPLQRRPSASDCAYACRADGRDVQSCEMVESSSEPLVAVCRGYSPAQCVDHIPSGRAPETLDCRSLPALQSAAAYFSRSAYWEAASAHAFRVLVGDLRRHQAPQRLVRAAERAAADERRHARAFQRLASRAGYATPRVAPPPVTPRGLLQLALENAAEGCVIETYSALVAAYQAQHAAAPGLRRMLSRIAREEAEHARLSWQLWSWCLARVGVRARARLHRELRDASARLAQRLPDLRERWATELGLPRLEVAREMFACLSADLWEPPGVVPVVRRRRARTHAGR